MIYHNSKFFDIYSVAKFNSVIQTKKPFQAVQGTALSCIETAISYNGGKMLLL